MAASRSCCWWWWWDFILGLVAFFFIPFPSVECAVSETNGHWVIKVIKCIISFLRWHENNWSTRWTWCVRHALPSSKYPPVSEWRCAVEKVLAWSLLSLRFAAEMLDNLRGGIFAEDRELKCYTMCIAQMAGTVWVSGSIVHLSDHWSFETLSPSLTRWTKRAKSTCRKRSPRWTRCYRRTCGTRRRKRSTPAAMCVSIDLVLWADENPALFLSCLSALPCLILLHAEGRYKDSCDKTFYSTKCLAEYDRDVFLFPWWWWRVDRWQHARDRSGMKRSGTGIAETSAGSISRQQHNLTA